MKIRNKLLYYFLITTTIPILFLGFLSFQIAKNEIIRITSSNISTIAESEKNSINSILDQNMRLIQVLAESPTVIKWINHYLDTPSREDRLALTYLITMEKRQISSFKSIRILDLNGKIITATDGASSSHSYIQDPNYIEGKQRTSIRFEVNKTAGSILFFVPIISEQRSLGVLLVESSDWKDIIEAIQEYTHDNKTSESLIVEEARSGNINYLTPRRFYRNSLGSLSLTHSNVPAVHAILKEEAVFQEMSDYRNIPVIAATRYIESTNSGLVVKIDKAEALQPVRNMLILILLCMTLVILAASIISFSISESIANPVNQLSKGMQIVAEGNLEHIISIDSEDELEYLANSFNEMTAQLSESYKKMKKTLSEKTEILGITEKQNQELTLAKQTMTSLLKDMHIAQDVLIHQKNELEQFAYVASHDLQEPLRAITSFTQLLEAKLEPIWDEKDKKYMGFIIEGTTRMQQLIEGLLAYSRVQSSPLHYTPVNLNTCVEKALQNLQIAIIENQAKIKSSDLPTVLGEELLLTQLLQNLIGNAIKFRSKLDPEIKIQAESQDGCWIISVSDNGIGINPSYLDKIFGIFERLHTRDKYPGTGLGLAICKKIVERYGGTIWVTSKTDEGSTFIFSLPQKS